MGTELRLRRLTQLFRSCQILAVGSEDLVDLALHLEDGPGKRWLRCASSVSGDFPFSQCLRCAGVSGEFPFSQCLRCASVSGEFPFSQSLRCANFECFRRKRTDS